MTETRDMEIQAEFLQHNITIGFLPYQSDMPYRIIVENNPINFVDPNGLINSGKGWAGVIVGGVGLIFKNPVLIVIGGGLVVGGIGMIQFKVRITKVEN